MEQKLEFIIRTRKLASLFIRASDEYASLASELAYRGWDKPAEEGGLGQDAFTGPNAELTREDIFAFLSLVGGLLTPLTPEQRALFYRLRATSIMGPPLL